MNLWDVYREKYIKEVTPSISASIDKEIMKQITPSPKLILSLRHNILWKIKKLSWRIFGRKKEIAWMGQLIVSTPITICNWDEGVIFPKKVYK